MVGEDVRNPFAVGTGLENENEVVACGIIELVIRTKVAGWVAVSLFIRLVACSRSRSRTFKDWLQQ